MIARIFSLMLLCGFLACRVVASANITDDMFDDNNVSDDASWVANHDNSRSQHSPIPGSQSDDMYGRTPHSDSTNGQDMITANPPPVASNPLFTQDRP